MRDRGVIDQSTVYQLNLNDDTGQDQEYGTLELLIC